MVNIEMAAFFRTVRLGDIVEFTNGGAWGASEYVDHGIPVVRVSDISNETIEMDDCKFLAESSLTRYRKHILCEGDLVIATVGSHPTQPASVVGRAGIVPKRADGALLNQNAVRLKPKGSGVLQKYLGFLGRSNIFRNYIVQSARGSANQVRMSIALLKEMPVPLPPVSTQRKIAAILSAYDDLIENNTRRIAILEEMARLIYREWFVHFRFPGHEGVEMVETEVGLVPEGWGVTLIGDVVETVGGGTPSTKQEEYWDKGDIVWYTPSDLTAAGTMFMTDSSRHINEMGLNNSSAKMFPPYSMMMTSRATLGVTSINTTPACTNQGFITCVPNERLSVYQLYFWVEENMETIINLAGGATYKEIRKTTFREMPIVIPDQSVSERFNELIVPIGAQIETLQRKNGNLRETRDLLLPRLVSGEVDVSEVEMAGVVA